MLCNRSIRQTSRQCRRPHNFLFYKNTASYVLLTFLKTICYSNMTLLSFPISEKTTFKTIWKNCWNWHEFDSSMLAKLPVNEVAGRQYFHRCLSFCSGGSGVFVTITHDRYLPPPLKSDLGTYPLPLPHLTEDLGTYPFPLLLTSGGHHWRPVQTCSLENLPTPWYWHLVVATETHTVGKQAVCILLECFLSFFI